MEAVHHHDESSLIWHSCAQFMSEILLANRIRQQRIEAHSSIPNMISFPPLKRNAAVKLLVHSRYASLVAAAPLISAGMLRILGSHRRWTAISICANLTLVVLLMFKAAPHAQPHRWVNKTSSPVASTYHNCSLCSKSKPYALHCNENVTMPMMSSSGRN